MNGKLTERMYMKQPEGYDDRTGCVCWLIKTLYSLTQAGREWNIELDTKLCKKCHGPVTVSCTQPLGACLCSFDLRFRDEQALTVARDMGNPD